MHKRLNISLPEETVGRMDRAVKKGDRSSFIDQAVNRLLDEVSREKLRDELREGYVAWEKENREVARDWFSLEEEAWQNSGL